MTRTGTALATNGAAAIAERDEFIGMLGHELRNAIAPLMILAENFAETTTPDAAFTRRRGLLVKHLYKLCATLDRITEVSQLRAGKLELRPEQTELSGVVGEVCDRLEPDAAGAGIHLYRALEPDVIGLWDPERLDQIVANLVGNAIRHGGASRIEVAARRCESLSAEVVVRDDGAGIPEAARATIFDRVRNRGHGAGGLGVGLWVARTLAEAMGGGLVLEPTLAGACFRLRLPTRVPPPA
jgi:signal transduction histidine kinase